MIIHQEYEINVFDNQKKPFYEVVMKPQRKQYYVKNSFDRSALKRFLKYFKRDNEIFTSSIIIYIDGCRFILTKYNIILTNGLSTFKEHFDDVLTIETLDKICDFLKNENYLKIQKYLEEWKNDNQDLFNSFNYPELYMNNYTKLIETFEAIL